MYALPSLRPTVPLLPSPRSELLKGVPLLPSEAPFTPYLVSVTGRLRNREEARSHVFERDASFLDGIKALGLEGRFFFRVSRREARFLLYITCLRTLSLSVQADSLSA